MKLKKLISLSFVMFLMFVGVSFKNSASAVDPKVEQYVKSYFKVVDSKDATGIASHFTEDGSFRFGNMPASVGRKAIEEGNVIFFSLIAGLHHDIVGVWVDKYEGGDIIFMELAVIYTRKNGTKTAPLPFLSTVRMKGDKMYDFRIFGDNSPIFQI